MNNSLFIAFIALSLVACSSSEDDTTPATTADAAAEALVEEEASAPDAQQEAANVEDSASSCKLTKPYSTSMKDCNDCAEKNCCAEVNACYENLACDDSYVNCMLACVLTEDAGKPEIDACIADCGTQYPEGKQIYETLDSCVVGKCTTECQ